MDIIDPKLLPAIKRIIGVGPHYRSLRIEKGLDLQPEEPMLFLKNADSITTATEIVLSERISEIYCEVEMGVLIGQEGYQISQDEALSYISGCAIVNDITAVDKLELGQHKMFLNTTPIGPFVKVDSIQDVTIRMSVNGRQIQNGHTSEMTFSIYWLIAYISTIMRLKEGDLILTGTPAHPTACKSGDFIELSSPELGSIRHTLKQEVLKP
ncbi:fumarylacetoacetate hydrolase family protein [Paenibacillus sp. WQ 127069]|uniref:Fumarylacetoacetate hydrolase family protein n=1 Tax=Paenibacillus baimaensis TaxID=2982185 RepID=A0ABT2UEL6_9BACL|nr:fumarylacetoacetate hydrolase family protein [Paenibacillus sp. WQ 127069]MCU6792576.1 fumarylacetoacetate hydrolase family protein [Paenibacillus sp. WQ 127069]